MFQNALNTVRGGGGPITSVWNFALDREATDLPGTDSVGTLLGYRQDGSQKD